MNKATIVVEKAYQNNKLFDLSDKKINRDNCIYPYYLLRDFFLDYGIDLSTQDIYTIDESKIVIYNEVPEILPMNKDIDKSYLLLFESELIRPDNWNLDNHQYFSKIFTWNDDFVDNEKYFKFNFSQKIPKSIDKNLAIKENLCTLIAGNKSVNHPLELYSKRVESIRWFEQNHLNDFDFYGIGWDEYRFGNKYLNFFFKKLGLSKIFQPVFPSYKGMIESKKEILQKYKFAICYENARDIPGYITEKIFDCFFAGCVPIYWGANNITDFIPKKCFIDRREFTSYEELYTYIKSMQNSQYQEYLDNINKYIISKDIDAFSSNYFAKKIINTIVD